MRDYTCVWVYMYVKTHSRVVNFILMLILMYKMRLTCIHTLCFSIVRPKHIPALLWALWREPHGIEEWDLGTALRIGTALGVPWAHVGPQKALDQYRLLRVIEVFGETTPFEERTWKRIHKAVKSVGGIDITNNIEETHKDLNELCKLLCFNL